MSHTERAHEGGENANDSRQIDRRGDHPKTGLPGKIQRARTTAPDGADDSCILEVASIAHNGGQDPAEVWAERANGLLAYREEGENE